MKNEWMLDVLADLKTFSLENGLAVTGKQIDLVMAVAAEEITSMQGIAPDTLGQGIGNVRRFHREITSVPNARRTQ
jgi:predicted transcriptional regulator